MRRVLLALLIGALLALVAFAARDVGAGAAPAYTDDNDHLLDGVPGLGGPKP